MRLARFHSVGVACDRRDYFPKNNAVLQETIITAGK